MRLSFLNYVFNSNFISLLFNGLLVGIFTYLVSPKDLLSLAILIEVLTYITIFLFKQDVYGRYSTDSKQSLETPASLVNLRYLVNFLPFTLLLSLVLLFSLLPILYNFSSLDLAFIGLISSIYPTDSIDNLSGICLLFYFFAKLGQGVFNLWNYKFTTVLRLQGNVVLNILLKVTCFKALIYSSQFLLRMFSISVDFFILNIGLFFFALTTLTKNKNLQSYLVLSSIGTYLLILWVILGQNLPSGLSFDLLLNAPINLLNINLYSTSFIESYLLVYNIILLCIIFMLGYLFNTYRQTLTLSGLVNYNQFSLVYLFLFILLGLPVGGLFFVKVNLLSDLIQLNSLSYLFIINLLFSSFTGYMLVKVLYTSKSII